MFLLETKAGWGKNELKKAHDDIIIDVLSDVDSVPNEQLKLYVWEDVLRDHTSGVMFALAKNTEDARDLIESKLGQRPDDLAIEPREIKEREGFAVYGGG